MKRAGCILCGAVVVLAASAGTALAQMPGWALGIKGGLHFSDLRTKETGESGFGINFDRRLGFAVGAFISFDISNSVALQPEVLFTRRGGKSESTLLGELTKLDVTLDYLEVPILLKLYAPTRGSAALYLFGGPTFAWKLDAKSVLQTPEMEEEQSLENIKSTDTGLAFGAGLEFGSLLVEGRYTIGLSNILDSELAEGEIKHGILSFMAGLSF